MKDFIRVFFFVFSIRIGILAGDASNFSFSNCHPLSCSSDLYLLVLSTLCWVFAFHTGFLWLRQLVDSIAGFDRFR